MINWSVVAKDVNTGEETIYTYDKLVIAVGASPAKPPIEGVDLENVFFVRTPEDAIRIRNLVDTGNVKKAVVVGAGYIGLEIAENLKSQGIRPFVLDMVPQILAPGFDKEMADYVEGKLVEAGIPVVTGVQVTGIEGDGKVEKVLTSKKAYKADMVVMSAGIRPNTAFLADTGIEMFKGTILTDTFGQTNIPDIYAAGDCAMVHNAITIRPNTAFLADTGIEMFKGTILTDTFGQTNIPDIYAAGDCAMVHNAITGKAAWSPMGSTANIAGRLIAQNIMGKGLEYRGVLGTAVCKLPGVNVGRTGLTEAQAKEEGFQPVMSVITVVDDKAHYYVGASTFIIKMIADKESLRLLGVQVIGSGAVDKIVDIAVTGITMKATLTDLAVMDLAYAPPFSTAIHPFEHTLNVLMNKIQGNFETFTPAEYLLGVQVIGSGAVDKIVDIAVTGITMKATLTDLADMDLAYAPPFSTAIHPFEHTLNVLMNKIQGNFETFTPAEYAAGEAEGYRVVDGCLIPSIDGEPYVELTVEDGPVD